MDDLKIVDLNSEGNDNTEGIDDSGSVDRDRPDRWTNPTPDDQKIIDMLTKGTGLDIDRPTDNGQGAGAGIVDFLVKSFTSPAASDSIQSKIVKKALRKKLLHHPNLKNKDVVRSKWIRLLASRPSLYQYWSDVVESGRHKELMRLDLSLLEKEMGPTDQRDVMKAIMLQYVAGGPSCCDEILDGFEVVPGSVPHIRWRDGDRMMDMTCMRLEKLAIVRDDEFHFDITDSWDREAEDRDVLLAWQVASAS